MGYQMGHNPQSLGMFNLAPASLPRPAGAAAADEQDEEGGAQDDDDEDDGDDDGAPDGA